MLTLHEYLTYLSHIWQVEVLDVLTKDLNIVVQDAFQNLLQIAHL